MACKKRFNDNESEKGGDGRITYFAELQLCPAERKCGSSFEAEGPEDELEVSSGHPAELPSIWVTIQLSLTILITLYKSSGPT